MRIYTDEYIGKKYGKLTVVAYDHSTEVKTATRTRYTHYFKFRCECGREKVINIHNVLSGRTQSCGKCHKDKWIGEKVGKTTIVSIKKIDNKSRFVLKCDCGEVFDVSQSVVSINKNNKYYTCKKCRKVTK